MRKTLLWMTLAGIACSAQTMPYPVGYVYTTSVVDENNFVMTAATVSDTYGESGHTTSAAVKITSPDGRTAYGTGAWAYSSFASTGLSLCDSAGTCYDGLFIARSEGTQEYCPITFTYMVAGESLHEQDVPGYAYAEGAQWRPSSVQRKSGSSQFWFQVGKTANCPAGEATGSLVLFATEGLLYSVTPEIGQGKVVVSGFIGNEATIKWTLETNSTNPTAGTVRGTGHLLSAPCRILSSPSMKSDTLTVQ